MVIKERVIYVITASADSWLNFIATERRHMHSGTVTKLVLDFSETNFLEPAHIVSLACLIEEYAQKGTKIEMRGDRFYINKYLNNIRFKEYWETGFDRDAFTELNVDTTFCLWKVAKIMIDSYANEARKYFQNAYFEGKSLESLNIILAEVFNNIFDHSKSPVDGYVLTQCYPNIDKIVTSICDFGVGIPEKINEIWEKGGKERLSDPNALRAAFFRHVSSKSTPQNKGFGLANLYDIVTQLNGELIVYSQNGVLIRTANRHLAVYESNISFSGTLIIIKLDKRFLPDLDEELNNEEFIF